MAMVMVMVMERIRGDFLRWLREMLDVVFLDVARMRFVRGIGGLRGVWGLAGRRLGARVVLIVWLICWMVRFVLLRKLNTRSLLPISIQAKQAKISPSSTSPNQSQ